MTWAEMLGLAAAVAMPFFNIPFILRIVKRKSADDVSLPWVVGVWICIIAMLPSAIVSKDLVLKSFGLVNSVLFTGVFLVVLKYHKKTGPDSARPQ
jgi:uncharacterized protein with PQ loop repeat